MYVPGYVGCGMEGDADRATYGNLNLLLVFFLRYSGGLKNKIGRS